MLEQLRKDRIRREGGKLVFHAEGEMEVDSQGVKRPIPNADDIVDTDIFHGSMQRMHIDVVLPELVTKRISNAEKKFKLQGELCCVIQFGFENAILACQRVSRRWIARCRRYYELNNIAYLSFHMAALRLQSWFRRKQAVLAFKETLDEIVRKKQLGNVTVIQKSIRGFIAYRKYRRYADAKYERKLFRTISIFQALIRGFNCRRRRKHAMAAMAAQRNQEEEDWAATQIQKIARRRIVQNTYLKSVAVRRTISKDLLQVAEKYLNNGDLWGFLEEIDNQRRRLKDTIKSNQDRENEMASTFIKQVLTKRQEDFDGAWDKFSSTVKKGGVDSTEELLSKDPNDKFSAISSPMKQKADTIDRGGTSEGKGKMKGKGKGKSKGGTKGGDKIMMSKSMNMDTMVQVITRSCIKY